MTLRLNGNPIALQEGATVAELLSSRGIPSDGVAVAVNRTIVPKRTHGTHRLEAGDDVEVVRAVGGG